MKSFHFIMTAVNPVHNGLSTATFSGTYVPISGETRQDIYNKIFQSLAAKMHVEQPGVMFFSLEPNELSAV